MALRDRIVAKAPMFKGQKSGLPIESYGIENAELIKNFFLKDGQLKKVSGSTTYANVLLSETGGITSLHRYAYLNIAQRGTTLSVEIPEVVAGFNDLATGLITSRKRLYSAGWRGRVVFTNGDESLQLFYKNFASNISVGASPNNLGLDSPDAVSTLTFTVAGGNIETGDHYYLISLYDSTTNTESPPCGAFLSKDGIVPSSPNALMGPQPILKVSEAAGKKFTFDAAPLYAYLQAQKAKYSRATHFIVYRSKAKDANGLYQSFFRVPQKDGGAFDGSVIIPISYVFINTFVDNTSDSSLPAVSPPENASPPPTPARFYASLQRAKTLYGSPENFAQSDYSGFRHIRFFRDQLFGIGARSGGYTVTEASLDGTNAQKVTGVVNDVFDLLHGSEVYQPDYFPYVWEVGRGDGQTAVGVGVLGDTSLLCFKDKSTYYLSGSSPDNFVLRIMDTQKGCLHQSTIQETPSGVITLDRSGFVLWDKIGEGTRVSQDIKDIIDNIQFQYASTFYSCYDHRYNLYRCSVVTPGYTTPNITLILNLTTMEWSTEFPASGYSSRVIDTTSSGALVDLSGSSADGRIYSRADDTAVLNLGSPIEAIWTSGTINFGDDQHQKRMEWVYIRAKSIGSWKVTVEVIPDYDESRKFVQPDWDVVASSSLWYSSDIATDGTLLWDDGTGLDGGQWAAADVVRQVTKIPVKCIGRTFQIRITNKEADATRYGFAIESVSCEASALGR